MGNIKNFVHISINKFLAEKCPALPVELIRSLNFEEKN